MRLRHGCLLFQHVKRIDAIGGWTTEGVGHQYGKGHSLTVMYGWMEKLTSKVQEPGSVETVT